jgi:O-antigen/teichoic acid export membrane protein
MGLTVTEPDLPIAAANPLANGPRVADIPRRGPLRRFINRLEVDQAVFYSLCLRLWQFVAGPISIVMIGTFFSEEVQGYFYTFASLMALQSFFELGLHIVIINVSSHEWSKLQLDETGRIRGDAAALSRLVSLGRLLFRWYAVAAVLFAIGVGIGGGWFLARKDLGLISWQSPWIGLVLLTALMLWQLPYIVLLEGCGQMPVVNRYRVYQAMTGNVVVWTCMAIGFGLWAAVAAAAVQVAWNSALIWQRYRTFFSTFRESDTDARMDWRTELWPMQWRLAISAVLNYFAFQLFTPVIFNYHGPAAAGQMGMTWQLATVVQAVALAWVQTRAPLFGQLVSKRDYRELDRIFFRLTKISLAVVISGCLALGIAVWGAYWTQFRLASRFLEPMPTAMFLLAIAFYHIPNCQALYIRAHKRDPLFPLSVATSIIMGASVWWFGSRYGPTGAAAAYLSVVVGLVFPWQSFIWWQCRKTH